MNTRTTETIAVVHCHAALSRSGTCMRALPAVRRLTFRVYNFIGLHSFAILYFSPTKTPVETRAGLSKRVLAWPSLGKWRGRQSKGACLTNCLEEPLLTGLSLYVVR